MLGRYNNCVNLCWLAVNIFNSNLCLAVRTEVSKSAVLAHVCKALCKLVSERNWHWHKLRSFVAGIAEHHALVARACGFVVFRGVNALCDVRGLLVDRCDNCAGCAVEAVFCSVIADVKHSLACDFWNVNIAGSCDFAHYVDETCCNCCFAGNAGSWVLLEYCVEDSVGDLVTDFVWMTFCYAFTCK